MTYDEVALKGSLDRLPAKLRSVFAVGLEVFARHLEAHEILPKLSKQRRQLHGRAPVARSKGRVGWRQPLGT